MIISREKLTTIYGGGVSAALVSAVVKATQTILKLGQIVGSSIRRIIKKCPC